MRIGLPGTFLLLILSQVAHSVEEYAGGLWDVLTPARVVGRVLSEHPSTGFAVANMLIAGIGLLCYLGPVRHAWRGAAGIAWFWVALELGNSIGHVVLAISAWTYVPGVYTAPFLFGFACLVAYQLLKAGRGSAGSNRADGT